MKQLSRALKERDEARRGRDEALAFQAASNEILAAISRSTSDAKPVFDAIVDCVRRLFGTRYVAVFLVKGEELHLAAAKSDAHFEREKAAVFRRFRDSFPQRIDWGGFTGKALRSGKVSQIAPIIGNPKATPQAVKLAKQFGYNAMLVAPLVRDGKAIGAIGTTRPEPEPFAARELALFKAFAAQAVIAIENARLFNETKEALERQTATSEVLRVISGTPADPQPVFEAIAQSAARVFNAPHTGVALVEGDALRLRATAGRVDPRGQMLIPFDGTSSSGSALLERRIVDVPDTEAVGAPPFARDSGRAVGFRAIASAPMLREGKGIGAITVMRAQPGALTDKQRQLLQTFADQAVIAIENARLFNETRRRSSSRPQAARSSGHQQLAQRPASGVRRDLESHAPCDAHSACLTSSRTRTAAPSRSAAAARSSPSGCSSAAPSSPLPRWPTSSPNAGPFTFPTQGKDLASRRATRTR
jgi:GAF domain-containing protein